MWLRLIMGGFLMALGLAVFISVCTTNISPSVFRFYGQLSTALVLAGVLLLIRGLKECTSVLKENKSKEVVASPHPTCD